MLKTLREFSIDCQEFNYADLDKLQMGVFIIKMLRYLDRQTFNAVAEGEIFKNEVMKPLEAIVGWNEKNDQASREIAEKLKEQIQGKKIPEKARTIKKFLTIGGGLAGLITGGIALINHKRKKK
ncbi:MAG: hypothetical protein AAB820_01390 [Patescibacteria group bacterium]